MPGGVSGSSDVTLSLFFFVFSLTHPYVQGSEVQFRAEWTTPSKTRIKVSMISRWIGWFPLMDLKLCGRVHYFLAIVKSSASRVLKVNLTQSRSEVKFQTLPRSFLCDPFSLLCSLACYISHALALFTPSMETRLLLRGVETQSNPVAFTPGINTPLQSLLWDQTRIWFVWPPSSHPLVCRMDKNKRWSFAKLITWTEIY